jgi:hypothetical protein
MRSRFFALQNDGSPGPKPMTVTLGEGFKSRTF